MKKTFGNGLVILALVVTAAAVCDGDVFFRWGAAKAGVSLDNVGGKDVFVAPVEINGGRADLAVYSWDDDYATVVTKVKQSFFAGAGAVFANGDELSMGMVSNASSVTRVMVVNLPKGILAFRLVQTRAEYEKSRSVPEGRLAGLPSFPGSVASFRVSNGEAGAGFELSRTVAGAAEVRAFFDSALLAEGWAPMVGAAAGIYGKGDDLCMLVVGTSGTGNETTIGLLHRKIAR